MSNLSTLISHYKSRGIVIDSNILLLLFIGSFNKKAIQQFKKTKEYTEEDFNHLIAFLKYFPIITTTPNILTEVINHSETFNKQSGNSFFEMLQTLIKSILESHIPSRIAFQNQTFIKFGLTDSTIHNLAEQGYLILTDDFPLYGYLSQKNFYAINFNHIRSEYILKT